MKLPKKLIMDLNYIHFKNIHIFINLKFRNLMTAENFKDKKNQKIHLFLTSHKSIDWVKEMIKICNLSTIIIHIPYQVKDIGKYIRNELNELENVKIFVERKPISFHMDYNTAYKSILDINYKDNEVVASIRLHKVSFNDFFIKGSEKGAIKNILQKEYPEMFKKEIIKNFKKECPKGILNTFKDDDDIWNYIMNNNEWK